MDLNTLLRSVAAAAALGAAWLIVDPSRDRAAPRPKSARPSDSGAVAATRPGEQGRPAADSDGAPLDGLAIQLHGTSYYMPEYLRMIGEIADLGANTVMLVTHGWQTHAGTCDLRFNPGRSPRLVDIGRLCDAAHERGLRVVLMPVVLLSAPRNTEWRGQINPLAGWDEWFRRYTRFMLEWARLCEAHRVELLMVGSELIKTEQYTDRWRQLIGEVRQFYRGKLGYSANWDHYTTDKVGFWPQLDYVGMTSYYTLAAGPRPTLQEVMNRWAPIKARILKFQREVRKPILFTEVGWCSQEGAASESWNYYHNQKATAGGHEEQVTCYRAFINTWGEVPEVGGTIWWEWTNEPGGAADFNYTPKGKPAEQVLREFFSRRRPAP